MQPLIFMADLTRGTTTRNSAQARNIKLDCLMNTKQLSLHPDKTGFIIWKTCKSNIQCGFTASKKQKDKWIGDILHQDGLAASTEATIKERTPV